MSKGTSFSVEKYFTKINEHQTKKLVLILSIK